MRTFSCLLCPEALKTTKELEEHVVGNFGSNSMLTHTGCYNVNGSVLPLQVSLGHWRRLGKLFVHGQLRQTFLPEAADDTQVLVLVCLR